MGLGDTFKSLVLTEYKADTKQMRSELKKLKGEQKDQAKAAIESAEKQNKAIDAQIAMLGKAVVAIGAVTAAYQVAEAGIESYQKRSRLSAATVGADIDGLKKATNGLVSETKLLEFASKAMNGTFKLSQGQMEIALQGALALRKEGNELTKSLENIGKALQEGTSEPLKELGINFKTANDTAVGVNDVLNELAKTAREKGGDLAIPGDEMAQSQIAMRDAVEDLKVSLGELAVKLAPVIAALAKMVSYMAKLGAVSDAIAGVDYEDRISSEKLAITQQLSKGEDPVLRRRLDDILRAEIQAKRARQLEESMRANQARVRAAQAGEPANSNTGRGGRGGGGRRGLSSADDADLFSARMRTAELEYGGSIDPALAEETRSALIAKESIRGIADGIDELEAKRQAFWAGQAGAEDARRGGILAGIFGTPAEIDAMSVSLSQLTKGFDGLANAFGAGVDALITGSESFASAFKNAIGESLRSMAVEMSISALKHTAYGLASLAWMDGRGAATHFAAAGQFAAGAVAAGGAARLLGAGQATTPAGGGSGLAPTAGSAGVGSASPANENAGQNQTIIVLGDDYGSMSTREREARIREAMRGAGIQATGDFVVNG